MKKFVLVLIGCWLTYVAGRSQIVTISEEIILRNDESYELIGMLKDRFLMFQNRGTEFLVQAFDEKLRLSWDKPIELDKRRPEVIGIVADTEGFDLFYKYHSGGSTIVKVHRYDPSANLVDSVVVKDYGSRFFTPKFEMIRSEDRSKVLIYFNEKQNEIDAVSFDLKRKERLWEKHLQVQDFVFSEEFLQILVDNTGNMHLILEKENERHRTKEHHFEIYRYDGQTDMLARYKVPLKGKLTYDIYFDYDNLNKSLVAGGLYSEKHLGRAEGYFYLNIKPDNPDDYLLKFNKFEDELVQTFLGKDANNKNKGILETSVQEVVLRRDGGLLLIAERTRQYERRVASTSRGLYDYSGSPFMVDYYYDDLLMISIHPSGRSHWEAVLHKKQYSQDDGAMYSSYFLFKTPTALRLIFNDEIKPENTVSEYIVEGNGRYNRHSVLSTENQKLRLRFRDAIQIAVNELIVPSERRTHLKLVKITF